MNNIDVPTQAGLIDGPGTILRRSREAKGLDVAAVAAMLHLSEFKITAIEADDFNALPEPVFVRGYLKNYARLLEEPVGPVLDAYSKFGFEVESSEQQLVESDTKVEVSGDHDLIRIASIVVMAAVILVPLVIWWDDLGQAVQKLVNMADAPKPELVIPAPPENGEATASQSLSIPLLPNSEVADESQVEEEAPERVKDTIQLERAQEPVVSAIKEIEPESSASGSESIPLSLPQQPEVAEEAKPVVEVAPEPIKTVVASPAPAPQPKPVKPAPAVDEGVWFNFVDSGWVKVRDAKDRVILIGEHTKGSRKRLTSTMPYKVVLGNSKAVQVEIDGKIADIERFSSGGVARFTIDNGKIDKP